MITYVPEQRNTVLSPSHYVMLGAVTTLAGEFVALVVWAVF